jgi:hypothetical protein
LSDNGGWRVNTIASKERLNIWKTNGWTRP